jgi:hypothetical protein
MRILTVVCALVLAVASAPTASADVEDDFVSALDGAGFNFPGGGRGNAVELGHWVCDSMDGGSSPWSLMYALQESSTRLAGTDGPEVFVTLAVRYLCPQHLPAFG